MLTFWKRNPIEKANKLIIKHFGRMVNRLINQVVFYSSDIIGFIVTEQTLS